MIKYFKWKNFFSYPNEGEIDFTVDTEDTSDENSYVTYPDCKVSKLAVIVGHNCSGKTNVIKILHFIRWFMTDSFHDRLGNVQSHIHPRNIPFMKCDGKSSFETCFIIDNNVYTYTVEFEIKKVVTGRNRTKLTVLSEKLTKDGQEKPIFNRDEQKIIFDREDNALYELSEKIVRPDASVIAALSISNNESMQKMQNFWRTVGVAYTTFYNSSNFKYYDIVAKELNKPENKDVLHRLEYELSELDIGNHKLKLQSNYNKIKNTTTLVPHVERSHKEKAKDTFILYPGYESNGFINVFFKLYDILVSITNKYPILAIDEIEASLHFEALLRIIKLFCDKENKHTQLLCTTHMSPILSHLEPYQVHMVDKNDDNESEIYRLDQVEGVTSDDDIYENYMSGLYGAFPNIFN